MALVAGVDSSTQSCKVAVRDAETGRRVRSGSAPHPPGTEVAPAHWWTALPSALDAAGGLADVAAVSVAGQQHGMVCLDAAGAVVRDALLWNDLRSAPDAADLIAELPGGAAGWAAATGLVPVASFTVTKLRWLARAEPDNAARTAAVCLPHDWLTWRLAGARGLDALVTDRGDASGTGYWSPVDEKYRPDLLELALGARPQLPAIVAPGAVAAEITDGAVLGAGTGDNAAAALALGARPGDVVVSIGTSGVISAVARAPVADPSGMVAGFADAAGGYLPLAATLNAARVLDAIAGLLRVSHDKLGELALAAPAGADGLVVVPYFEGERTPNRPDATGAVHGARLDNVTPQNLARAAIEGMLCGLADGLEALRDVGVEVQQALLIGGGARSAAVRAIAPDILGVPVSVPPAGEYVADGAARQAAWALSGAAEPPPWTGHRAAEPAREPGDVATGRRLRERYFGARELVLRRGS
jgi:xylulokinase